MVNEASLADHNRTILEEMGQRAFLGQAAYLRDAAAATDFTQDGPILPQRKRAPLYVYFIGTEHGPIKIGSARSPYQRLCTLQTANAEELYLFAYAEGGVRLERELHTRFSDLRLRGEWFRRSYPILHTILEWQSRA
jgi:hypothetical protein